MCSVFKRYVHNRAEFRKLFIKLDEAIYAHTILCKCKYTFPGKKHTNKILRQEECKNKK